VARASGDPVAAAAFARSAVSDLLAVHARVDLLDGLEQLGGAYAACGDEAKGARLLGAAVAARSSLGLVPPPAHVRPLLHEDVAAVGHLPAWTEGSSMSLEEAATYALRGRGRRRTATIGWDSLTPAEIEVASLAATGLTNAQIGERLLISRRTAQSHLSHIFTKLGLSSRAELAAIVSRTKA
jgi:DNA-binding CsgD family transcriptional regulator